MTPDDRDQLLSSIWEGIREIRGDQKAQAAQLMFLEGQRAKHEEAIENLKERQTGLHKKVVQLERDMHGPLLKPHPVSGEGAADGSIWFRIGMYISENRTTIAWLSFLSLGSLISIYNFIVKGLHHLPILPVPPHN